MSERFEISRVFKASRNRVWDAWEQGFSNEAGDIVPAPFPMPWPRLMSTTVVFQPEGESTRVTLTWEPIEPTKEELDPFRQMLTSMTGGWSGTFDQLDDFLASI